MTLHCLYAAPDSAVARRCLDSVAAGDALLLLSHAVTLANPCHPGLPDWQSTGVALYALQEDLDAHGVAQIDDAVTPVDYAAWIALTLDRPRQQLWA